MAWHAPFQPKGVMPGLDPGMTLGKNLAQRRMQTQSRVD